MLLGPRAAHLPVVLGAVDGAASGMYWFATNALTYDLIAPRQRSTFYGANGALGGIVGVVMPLLAGEAITRVGHGAGYRAVFATALVLYAVAFQVTRSLPDGHPVGGTTLSASLGLVATSRRWRSAWAGTAAASGFTAIWPVVAVSLAYAATDSAAAVALCTSVAAMAGALAAYALRSTTRISPAGGAQAALAMVAAAASLAWPGGGYPLLLAYGAVSAVAFAAIDLAMFRAMLEGIDAARDGRHSRSVHVLGMELAWGVGRVVSLALLALALLRWPGHATLVAAAIVSAFVQVPAAWWLHRAGAVSGAT